MMKVVTAKEMLRIEALAYAKGFAELDFMMNAGHAIAEKVEDYVLAQHGDKRVTLLCGKGNNAGDAFAAGCKLLAMGFDVEAIHIYPLGSCSPLCKTQYDRFHAAGGKIHHELRFPSDGVILDGLVGTGFRGKAEDELAEAIKAANVAGLPILAIDIPSGVNGDTGAVESVAIRAHQTISLGLPKIGFFIGSGWNHLGELVHADFGLPNEFVEEAEAMAYLPSQDDLSALLPPVKRNRHKYEAGYVVAIGGSAGMPGAAIMASFAALRAGAGIVRLFYPEGLESEVSSAPWEVIKEAWDLNNTDRIFEETKRASAFLIGPGIGREKQIKKMVKKVLPLIKRSAVIDADALYFLAENPSWKLPPCSILTPHRKEMERLLHLKEPLEESAFHKACQKYVEDKDTTLILKGGPSFVFQPHDAPIVIMAGDPAMAKAGTGDVLTGVLAALLAQKMRPRDAAILGASLHGMAGEVAAFHKTTYGVVASDLIECMPDAFAQLL